jgi:hypothetical protein
MRGEGVAPGAGPLIGLDVPGVDRRCPDPAQNPGRRWVPKAGGVPDRWQPASPRADPQGEASGAESNPFAGNLSRRRSIPAAGRRGARKAAGCLKARQPVRNELPTVIGNLQAPLSVLSSLSEARAW